MEKEQLTPEKTEQVEAIKVDYKDIVSYVTARSGLSEYRTRTILTSYGNMLQQGIKRGHTVHVDGIGAIDFRYKGVDIIGNTVYKFDNQCRDVANDTGLDIGDVRRVVSLYLKRVKDLATSFHHVAVKGFLYIIPTQEEDGTYTYTTRVSPVLEKPEIADFLCRDKEGTLYVQDIEEGLRFTASLELTPPTPSKNIGSGMEDLELETIDI